jgi:hypothetical protein
MARVALHFGIFAMSGAGVIQICPQALLGIGSSSLITGDLEVIGVPAVV